MAAKQVFVGNLAWAADEDDVREAFEAQDVSVDDVRVMKDETGKARGFGFVTLDARSDPDTVIERMNGVNVKGREIRVDHARGATSRRN